MSELTSDLPGNLPEGFETRKNEVWKEYIREDLRSKFMISNLGRVLSYPSNNPENPILLSGYKNMGYYAIPTKKKDGKNTLIYVHKLVAELFVPNPDNYKKLVFKDRKRENCRADNLQWMSKEEFADVMRERKSVYYYKPDHKPNTKLTPAKVALLKKMINDPNRKTRYKIIAKRFGINIGTLFSIKRGDSWKEVEPLK
ncbi:HNH endonuclease [Marinoscillum sp. MHG1-6]|uniref:HNH endonuclease n=1 Tax=Marinoscillum sp. MHG1-6 TaxID=2959627 RepID=UPI0021580D6E|nr:HNH endonuclease [Marinoscillum sp. MHG1-6]